MSQHSITIMWGQAPEPDQEPITYSYDTAAELCAFIEGVEAAEGWMDYTIVDDGCIYCHDCGDVHDKDLHKVKLVGGRKYRVAVDNAYMAGLKASAPGCWAGVRIPLKKGDVVTYQGMRNGWGSDPIPEHCFKLENSDHPDALYVRDLHPRGGSDIFDTSPVDGVLEEFE